tara:strand:- start:1305 stop:3029 length:1725 start_codon:yes stop_codon:yes gene_type:complete
MLPSFKQYLVEEQREVFFTYGRMNPPTTGHGKLMNAMSAKSGKSPYKIYLSQTQDARKNPLSYDQKIKHARKMYPKHARSIMSDKGSRTVFDVAVKLYDEGYNKVNMVVGADRLTEFKTLLNKYNNVKGRHGFYNFEKINIISSGDRDPDAEGLEGMSASKQRDNAKQNDFTLFSQGIPTSMSNRDAKKLFNDVRIGMGLKETREFYHKLNLEPVSETREKYIEGELFVEGDKVTVKSGQTGSIHRLGTNYVIVALDEGNVTRQWLEDVELIENSPIVKKGVVITTKKQPEEGTPQAVKKAVKMTPGIDRAQNILSRRRSFKEEVSQKELNDLEKFADRLLNKFDVDIEFTRHFADRMNDKRNKPAITVAELQRLFKKMAANKGKKIKKHGNREAILKDMQSDLNLPVVINWKNGEFEVVNKTIMRKKAFKSPDPELKYEQVIESVEEIDEMSTARAITAFLSKTFKAKKYREVAKFVRKEMEKDNGRHGAEYHAANILRKYNVKGVDARELGKVAKMAESIVTEDAVDRAKERIDREKEQDMKKHDRILDRARLARTNAINRKTKPKTNEEKK